MDSQVTKSKLRSPNYPGHSLKEAIDRIRVIYESQRQYPSTRETFARLLGYKGISGTSITVLSSLTKYGLMEGSGENLRVSDIGQDLALHREGDEEFARAVQEAAFRPAFFRELHDQYPDGLPSEHALNAFLKKRGFSDSAIVDAVKSYTETMALLKSLQLTPNTGPEPDEEGEDTANEIDGEAGSGTTAKRRHQDSLRTVVLPLQGATWAEIRGPFPISGVEWDLMVAVLNAMKPALTRSEVDEREGRSEGAEAVAADDMP
jgi:hypothetical protein